MPVQRARGAHSSLGILNFGFHDAFRMVGMRRTHELQQLAALLSLAFTAAGVFPAGW
jgi:hypothetical protein